ncbi:MAG: hypothetical protein WCV63_00115 [Negativicutes bacterium]|jgi:hypothetical protein
MNIDIFQILKLVFHLVEDTELKDNKTFQVVKEVVNSIDANPSRDTVQSLPQPKDGVR